LAVAAILLAVGAANAQEDRSQQALARAQALLRQVSAQKQELEGANARLAAEVDALDKKLKRAEAGLKEANAKLEAEQRNTARAAQSLENASGRQARLEERLRETNTTLRSTNAALQEAKREVAGLEGRVAELEGQLAETERKNLDLYQANVELLDLYKKKGAWAAMLQREPSGLKNVQIENTLQEYRLKLQDSLADRNRGAALGDAPGPSDNR
jgi:chromosome segregation ATPase